MKLIDERGNKSIEDIQTLLDEPSVVMPEGLTREEMREVILRVAEDSSNNTKDDE